jgi:hypothetical protein
MAGLDPAIHALAAGAVGMPEGVDHRVKPGDDDFSLKQQAVSQPDLPNRTGLGRARQ